MPNVLAAAMVITTMVTPAPDILMVQPSGIEIEYDSRGTPNFSHNARFTGMLAADDLVKKAVIAECIIDVNTRGYGFLKVVRNTRREVTTRAMTSIVATRIATM